MMDYFVKNCIVILIFLQLSVKEILQNLAISLIGAAQSWHAHRHEAKQP